MTISDDTSTCARRKVTLKILIRASYIVVFDSFMNFHLRVRCAWKCGALHIRFRFRIRMQMEAGMILFASKIENFLKNHPHVEVGKKKKKKFDTIYMNSKGS